MQLEDLLDELAEPFDVERISWKPQAVSGSRALAIAYADARTYQDRLNEAVGAEWSDDYEVLDDGAVVVCRLTICGVTRSDIGEAPKSDQNTATSALVQAFKRTCVKFGVGRYLYDVPKKWVDYDPQRKCFTRKALRELRDSVAVLSRHGAEQIESPRRSRGMKPAGEKGADDAHEIRSEDPKQEASYLQPEPEVKPERQKPERGVKETGRGAVAAPTNAHELVEGRRGADGSDSGTNGQKASPTAFWTLYGRHKNRVSREEAQEWAATGNWEYALAELRARVE